ncbi:MAG: hypothetical protein ACRC6M_18145 [Microcystaceae cyanobacterium]
MSKIAYSVVLDKAFREDRVLMSAIAVLLLIKSNLTSSEKAIAVTDNEVIMGLCSLTQITGSAIALDNDYLGPF